MTPPATCEQKPKTTYIEAFTLKNGRTVESISRKPLSNIYVNAISRHPKWQPDRQYDHLTTQTGQQCNGNLPKALPQTISAIEIETQELQPIPQISCAI